MSDSIYRNGVAAAMLANRYISARIARDNPWGRHEALIANDEQGALKALFTVAWRWA